MSACWTTEIDESVSIGDYVLSGGELPALVLIDTVVRLLPGVLGDEESAQQDSFVDGLLDWPHYTRPEVFEDNAVPAVLVEWQSRRDPALANQAGAGADLAAPAGPAGEAAQLTREQQQLLDDFVAEYRAGEPSAKTKW